MCTDFLLCNCNNKGNNNNDDEKNNDDDTNNDDNTDNKQYIIHSRTMEFTQDLGTKLVVQPRETDFKYGRLSPQMEPNLMIGEFNGVTQSNKYGYYYLSIIGCDVLPFDGINETGLSVGALYLPGFSHYIQDSDIKTDEQKEESILYSNLVHYILGNCESVTGIKELLQNKYVFDYTDYIKLEKGHLSHKLFKEITESELSEFHPPLHWICYDSDGKGIVIEMVEKQLQIYDSVGVMTNSPPYNWQITNLLQFQNLSSIDLNLCTIPMSNTTPKQITQLNDTNDGLSCCNPSLQWPHAQSEDKVNTGSSYGQGYSLRGLPGDWSPPSRFIRIFKIIECVFKSKSTSPKDNESAKNMAYHILNSVDIVKGCVVAKSETENTETESDYTQWAVIKDLKNLSVMIRVFEEFNWISFQLTDFNFEKGAQKQYYNITTGQPSLFPKTVLKYFK